MPFKILEDIVVENNGFVSVVKKGTIISEITHVLDSEEDDIEVEKDKLMSVIQDWFTTYKDSFGKSMGAVKTNYLQPAMDAIQASDPRQLKDTAIKLVKKIEYTDKLETKQKLSLIHSLYMKLLGMARGLFGESVDEILNIIKECKL